MSKEVELQDYGTVDLKDYGVVTFDDEKKGNKPPAKKSKPSRAMRALGRPTTEQKAQLAFESILSSGQNLVESTTGTVKELAEDASESIVEFAKDPEQQRNIGGIVGGGLGAIAGVPGGLPGAGVLGLAGEALGTQLVAELQDWFGIREKTAVEINDEITENAAMAAGVDAAAQALRSNFVLKSTAKILGLDTPEAWRRAFAGARQKIPLGAADVGGNVPRGFKKVFSVFPFAAGPVMTRHKITENAIQDAVERELNSLAPHATFNKMGLEIDARAARRHAQFQKASERLYTRAWDNAEAMVGNTPVVRGSIIRDAAEEIYTSQRLGVSVPTRSGLDASKKEGYSPEVLEKLEIWRDADDMSIAELRSINDDLSGLFNSATRKDTVVLARMKEATENAMLFLKLPPDDIAKLNAPFSKANDFYAKWANVFATPEAQKFKKVNKNVWEPLAEKYGPVEADKLLGLLIDKESAGSVASLYTTVGERTASRAFRTWFADFFEDSLTRIPGKDAVQFDFEKFRNSIGLDNARSKDFFNEVDKRSRIDVGAIRDIVTSAESLGPMIFPSTFVARRAVMGGLQTGLAAFVGTSAIMDFTSGWTTTGLMGMFYLFRKGADLISDPQFVRDVHNILMNPNLWKTDKSMAIQTATRVVNAVREYQDTQEEKELELRRPVSDVPSLEDFPVQ